MTYQQLFSSAMEQLNNSNKFNANDEEISNHVESLNSDCCEQTLTRSSSSASSSSAGCVFEGSEILGEDASTSSPSTHRHPCGVPSTMASDQTNWAEYLTLGVGEYNNCSHDDSGFRTETDESLCRTVSSCDLDFQEAGPAPAPRRPQDLNTDPKPTHTENNTNSVTTLPEDNTSQAETPTEVSASSSEEESKKISQGPVVLVENLDTPSSTSSCDEAIIANGQCSSTSHSCSSSRDSGLSSMAELDTSTSTASQIKNPSSSTEIKSEKPSAESSVAACCSSDAEKIARTVDATNRSMNMNPIKEGKTHLSTTVRSIPCAIGRVLERDALAIPSGSVMNRLRPPIPAPGCPTSQQFSICSGSCCNSECSASLG